MDEISADIVWGAAAAAHRINNAYVKETTTLARSNKEWVRRFLLQVQYDGTAETIDGESITDADIEQGRQFRAHVQGWMMAVLAAEATEYQKTAFRLASLDTFQARDNLSFAVIASLPSSVSNDMKFQKIRDHQATSQPLAIPVRGHFEGRVRILMCMFSDVYQTNYITALTEQGNLLRFSSQHKFKEDEEICIRGRVRGFEKSTTRLHYVKKVVDQKEISV